MRGDSTHRCEIELQRSEQEWETLMRQAKAYAHCYCPNAPMYHSNCQRKLMPILEKLDAALAAERTSGEAWRILCKGKEGAYVKMEQDLAAEREKRKPLVDAGSKLANLLKDSYWVQCPLDIAKAADELLDALANVKE